MALGATLLQCDLILTQYTFSDPVPNQVPSQGTESRHFNTGTQHKTEPVTWLRVIPRAEQLPSD